MTFKKGDVIRCTSNDYSFISYGGEYTVQEDQTRYDVIVKDDDGDRNDYPAADFELVRPVGGKLKLPLLFQTKGGAKYVLSKDGSGEGSLTVINAATGETYNNHVSEEKAIEFFTDGTWTANAQVKLKQDVENAKAALAKAEEALANSASHLA